MKLIIQIPCLNEAEMLHRVVNELPRSIEGIDSLAENGGHGRSKFRRATAAASGIYNNVWCRQ